MAFSEIKVNKIYNVNEADIVTSTQLYTALDSNGESSPTYGGYFQMDERDDKYLIAVKNDSGSDANIKIFSADGLQGVNDYDYTLANGKISLLNIESGRFKRVANNQGYADNGKTIPHGVSGLSEKGKVFISGVNKVSVAVITLPV